MRGGDLGGERFGRKKIGKRNRSAVLICVSARGPVAVVDDLQSLQRQLGIDVVDVLALFGEQRRQAAGGDDVLESGTSLLDAREDAVDEAEVAEVDARLHVDDGVRADHASRALDVDARQSRGAGEQRLGGDVQAGRDDAADVLARPR